MLPDIPEGETAEAAENSYTDIYGNRRPRGLQTSTDYQARRRIKERREENAKRKRGIDEQDLTMAIKAKFSGWVRGVGQSSWEGELQGLLMAVRAAAAAKVDAHIVIDNSTVCNTFKAIVAGELKAPPRWCFGIWDEIRELARGRRHSTLWCPSHGKRESWDPGKEGLRTAGGYRMMNAEADDAAGKALEARWTTVKGGVKVMERAERTTHKLQKALKSGSGRWEAKVEAQLAARKAEAEQLPEMVVAEAEQQPAMVVAEAETQAEDECEQWADQFADEWADMDDAGLAGLYDLDSSDPPGL